MRERCSVRWLDHLYVRQAALAGTVAAAAYVVEMYTDIALTRSRLDDLQLIEGAMRRRKARIPVLGLLIHLGNGAALGEIYGAVEPWLPGPGWLRGLLFGYAFLAAVWPSVPLVDRLHPLIRSGELPRLTSRVSFLQNVLRHGVFGLILGIVYDLR